MRQLILFCGLFALTGCPDVELGRFNASPEVVVTSHATEIEALEGYTYTFRAQVSDPDDPTAELSVTWRYLDEIICSAESPAEDGTHECDITIVETSGNVIVEVTDPDLAGDSAIVSVTTVPTAAPTGLILDPNPSGKYYSSHKVAFQAQLNDAEDTFDALRGAWTSDLDGDLTIDPEPDTSGIITGASYLSEGQHYIELKVTDSTGKQGTDSVVVDVGPPNTPPTCSITAPAAGTTLQFGELVTFEGLVDDIDISENQLAVQWSSDKDGILGTSTPDSSGNVIFPFSGLSGNSHVITMTVEDEVGEDCSQNLVIKVGMPPEITITNPTSGDILDSGKSIVFEGTVSDAEDLPNQVQIEWRSDLDGIINSDVSDSTGLLRFTTDDLQFGRHDITLTATDSDGLISTTHTVFNVNGIPSQPVVALTPSSPTTTDNLSVSMSTPSVDPDGSAVTYRYEWLQNGVVSTASTSSVLPSSATVKSDLWSVTVTPTDGISDGPSASATITIQNTAPTLSSATLTPTAPTTNDTLTCTPGAATDADGDTVLFETTWVINGSTSTTTSTILPASAHKKGDVLSCSITPTDGLTAGVSKASSTVTIQNSAPTISSVTLTPTSLNRADTLQCTASGVSDIDGDTVTLNYDWTVNSATTANNKSTLAGNTLTKGDVVTCTVTPSDNTDTGTAMVSSSVTVSNALPEVASATLSPSSANTEDDITCIAGVTSDIDGDTVTLDYAWFINSVTISSTSATLPHTAYSKGDSVVCELTPDDGTDTGTAVKSSPIVIANSAPTVASATISPSTPKTTDTIVCSPGATADDDGDTVSLTYGWRVNGTLNAVTTASLGSAYFTAPDTVQCEITPYDGTDNGPPVLSSSITVKNTPPVLSSVFITPTIPTKADTVSCTPGSVFDADGHTISYVTAWTVNSSTISATTQTLPVSAYKRGDVLSCTLTPNDGFDNGTAVTSPSVTVGNATPETGTPSVSPSPAFTDSTLTCTPSGALDADGDSVTHTYAWSVNSVGISATTSTLASSWFAKGDAVRCSTTPSDGTSSGTSKTSAPLSIQNTAPTLVSASISPTTALAADTLTCAWSGFNDIDGDSDASTVSWRIGGSEVGTATTLSGSFVGGETVTCIVTPYDGSHQGTPVTASVTIDNTPPVLSSVALTPSTPVTSATLTCTPGSATDDDLDVVTFTYAWLVNGTATGTSTTTLASTAFVKGDTVACEVTPTDGIDTGATVRSPTVSIGNTAPTLSAISFSPSVVYTDTVLTALPTATDPDPADTVTFTYQWLVNGTATGSSTSTLDGTTAFTRGDTVAVRVTPFDGTDSGTPMTSSTITVVNRPPSAPGVVITPASPLATIDDLVCTLGTASTDADGDTVTYSVSWKKNGSIWTGATSTATRTGDTINAVDANEGDVWTCIVTPNDGIEDGTDGLIDATVVPCTGRTATCPALNCKEVLDDGASIGDGNYYLDPDEDGTAILGYCDMSLDGGGWTLIAQGGMGNCGDRIACGSSCGLASSTNMRDTDTCRYLSYSVAADFADLSTEVMLTVNTKNTTFGTWDSIAYSTNAKAVDAFDTSSGSWHNGATFDNWTFNTACSSFYATGWPNMYHACGYGNGVHWLAVHRSMDHDNYKSEVSGTWLR